MAVEKKQTHGHVGFPWRGLEVACDLSQMKLRTLGGEVAGVAGTDYAAAAAADNASYWTEWHFAVGRKSWKRAIS